MKSVLTADIGGTKTVLAVARKKEAGIELLALKRYESRKFASFDDILDSYQSENPSITIQALCAAVAGPIIDNRCVPTNLKMTIDGGQLVRKFGLDRAIILNDLEASGYGLEMIPGSSLVKIRGETTHGNRVLISPGTGLGESIIHFIDGRYIPIPSEGGHTDFAPFNGATMRLWSFLKRSQTRVAVEDLLSGPGMNNIYKFLVSESGADLKDDVQSDLAAEPGAAVAKWAIEQNDHSAIQAIHLFLDILAAESGNLALKAMSYGGIYIGGGIVPQLIRFLDKTKFGSIMADKGTHRLILEKMPIFVVNDTRLPLYGAANFMISTEQA